MSESHRVEFKLSMPGRASWNGGWSGEGKNYTIVRDLSDAELSRLFDLDAQAIQVRRDFERDGYQVNWPKPRSWTHCWSDGWVAQITARVVRSGEQLKQSDGFHGYEWMVDNILSRGTPHGEVTS